MPIRDKIVFISLLLVCVVMSMYLISYDIKNSKSIVYDTILFILSIGFIVLIAGGYLNIRS